MMTYAAWLVLRTAKERRVSDSNGSDECSPRRARTNSQPRYWRLDLNSVTLDATEDYSYMPSSQPAARALFEPDKAGSNFAQVACHQRETARRNLAWRAVAVFSRG